MYYHQFRLEKQNKIRPLDMKAFFQVAWLDFFRKHFFSSLELY